MKDAEPLLVFFLLKERDDDRNDSSQRSEQSRSEG